MTVKQYILKHGLRYDCEPGLHRAISVIITFTNISGENDSTEFSLTLNDPVNELDRLFSEFCKENGFPRNTVTYISIVRAAQTMNQLVAFECNA